MFKTIMVPVDLRHLDKMEKALKVADDLAGLYDTPIVYVAITTPTPGPLGHTPEEFGKKLAEFAAARGKQSGRKTDSMPLVSDDPSIDLDKKLLEAVKNGHADLVVMASHIPNITDYVWPSHGGHLAGHAASSVMIVRP